MEQTPSPVTSTPPSTPPKNWLVESILVTLFCCLPFGIVGIVFASQVNAKWTAGDYAGASKAAADAGKWTKIGFWVGIAQIVLALIWIFLLGGLALFTASQSSNFNNY